MRKFLSTAFLAVLTLGISACGGGDDAFQTPGAGPGGTTVASIAVTSSGPSVPADGSDSVTIRAVARDANNAAVAGVTVQFASSAGGTVTVTQAETDDSGVATATLSSTDAAAGDTLTVTVSAGTVTNTVDVSVVDTQQTVSLSTSSPQILSASGAAPAVITALVRGANNQTLEGVEVDFTASSGGLTVTQGTTDENGVARATLTAAGDPANRTITVSASAGSATAEVPVEVTGTSLNVTGPSNLVIGSVGTYTVTLTDSANAPLANRPIAITSENGNQLSAATVNTGPTGVTFTVTATESGDDVITVSALGLEDSQEVSVSDQSFSFTAPAANANVNVGTSRTVTVHWESAGSPVPDGTEVTFAATRGVLNPVDGVATTTGGNASVSISSATSGPSTISASGADVSADLTINFIATTPTSIGLQATPSAIPTDGQSTITARVRDGANNLVQGKTVDFVLTDITGGSLTVASAVTDSQGRAQTVYNASSTPSSSDGVTIEATVRGAGLPAASTTLTVGGQALRLVLGTGNKLLENDSQTLFVLPYNVQVSDASGHAVDGATVTLTVHSVPSTVIGDDSAYGKGAWRWNGISSWAQDGTPLTVDFAAITTCANEDANLNGVLDPGEDDTGDGNGNHVLDPGDVAVTVPGSVVTANGGQADFNIQYPQDHAAWVRVELIATATVEGTENSTSAIFWLPMLAEYLTTENVAPPGRISPYGTATTCPDPN